MPFSAKLTETEILDGLVKLPDWKLSEGKLTCEFKFEAYPEGLNFASQAGMLGDAMDHHPDLYIGYRKVRVDLETHDVGGLSALDFDLATKISRLLP